MSKRRVAKRDVVTRAAPKASGPCVHYADTPGSKSDADIETVQAKKYLAKCVETFRLTLQQTG